MSSLHPIFQDIFKTHYPDLGNTGVDDLLGNKIGELTVEKNKKEKNAFSGGDHEVLGVLQE